MKRLFRWKQISPPLKLETLIATFWVPETTKRPRCITVSEKGSLNFFSLTVLLLAMAYEPFLLWWRAVDLSGNKESSTGLHVKGHGLVSWFDPFLFMDDIGLHEPGRESNGDRSLTHLHLINLFIKVELNIFSSTSPAKYCFCLKHFMAYVWLVNQSTREK